MFRLLILLCSLTYTVEGVPTVPPGCVNRGTDSYTCASIRTWYETVEEFCNKYGTVCCDTCMREVDGFQFVSTTTEAPICEDEGYWGFGCDVMQMWYRTFDLFCAAHREENCCATCRDRRKACKNFGFAGISCASIRKWTRNDISFCTHWGKFCCEYCSSDK